MGGRKRRRLQHIPAGTFKDQSLGNRNPTLVGDRSCSRGRVFVRLKWWHLRWKLKDPASRGEAWGGRPWKRRGKEGQAHLGHSRKS